MKFLLSEEIEKVCGHLKIGCRVLPTAEASELLCKVFEKYSVTKKAGHLSIGSHSVKIPTEQFEFTYSEILNPEPVYMFFDQKNYNKKDVVVIDNGRNIGLIMANSIGMEYFITDMNLSYLIAVNWYMIEAKGSIEPRLNELL